MVASKYAREIAALQSEACEIRANFRKLAEAFILTHPAWVSYLRTDTQRRCVEICAKISKLRGGTRSAFRGRSVAEGASAFTVPSEEGRS